MPCLAGFSPLRRAGAACSGKWREVLGLEEVTETPSANGTAVYLHARGMRGGVAVSVTATVYDGEEDSR